MIWRKIPKTARDYLKLADRAFEQMKFTDAVDHCQQALALEPRNAEAYFILGMCAAVEDKLREAVAYFEHAVECDPKHAEAEYALGNGYELLGQLAEAERHFRRAAELNPEGREEALERIEQLGRSKLTDADICSIFTSEEINAAKRIHRLQHWVEQALLALGVIVLAHIVVLREALWIIITNLLAGHPLLRTVDGLDQFLIGLFIVAMIVAASIALSSFILMRRQLAQLNTQGLDKKDIKAYINKISEKLELDEFRTEQAEQQRQDDKWIEEKKRAKPWWKRELSGAHLVWWIAFLLWTIQELTAFQLPSRIYNGMMLCLFLGGIVKIVIPALMLRNLDTHRMAIRYYRWWGRGWLPPLLAFLPFYVGYLVAP